MQADIELRIAALNLYPVKSCGGVALDDAMLVETGLDLDRAWMVVDRAGGFVSQRVLPRMALIRPTLKTFELVLRAPGMLALHLEIERVEARVRVRLWDDEVAAFDLGDLAAQWFSDFLGRPLRMVRFDPDQRRLSNRRWTGALEAENAFGDAFPLLVMSSAGLGELNRRLALAGDEPVTMARFRPNLVVDGLLANGEDHLDELRFEAADGPVVLKLVKPCVRCPIPDVDPLTGVPGHAVGDALAAYRADPRMDGAITFGMNAAIVDGVERTLRVGMTGSASFRFD